MIPDGGTPHPVPTATGVRACALTATPVAATVLRASRYGGLYRNGDGTTGYPTDLLSGYCKQKSGWYSNQPERKEGPSATGHDAQGSTILTPHPAKSETFLVATDAPADFAIAAICASNCAIGRPDRRRVAAISA